MRELFSLKAVFFSFAISLALFSCSNLQDGTQGAGGLVGQGQGAQSPSAAITRTIGGSLVMSGLFPRGFGSKPSAVSKTLFPASDSVDSSALDYFVTASHAGLSDISGTVTAGAGGVLTYSITLPFSSDSDSWNLTVTGKDGAGKIFLSSDAVAVKASDSEKNISLSYAKDPSGEPGSISISVPVSAASGIASAVVAFGSDAPQTVNVAGGSLSFSKSGVAPGVYSVKILFYSEASGGGEVLYAISETANIYSNLATSVPYGSAEYIESGSAFASISAAMVSAMQSVAEGGIWLGGTGPTGIAADDSNSGTKFKPVASLWRAAQIANALAGSDATKTYTINVQGNVRAGTDDEDAEIAAAAKVVVKGTNSTSYWTISGYDGSGPRDFVTSSSASAAFQYLAFDKLTGFEVAAGKVTMNDCQVSNGSSAENGIAGGITVDAGAEFVSSQGLKITACENSAGAKSGVAGGGGGIWSEGTVALEGAEISHCSATGSSSMGGGIYAKGGSLSLSNTSVADNSSVGGGAGIYIGNASFSIDADSSVTGNSASGSSSMGGGLYVYSTCSNEITLAGTFCSNSANSGGAVCSSSAADFTIGSGAVIGKEGEGNTAAFGGGVYHTGSGELKMTGGTIAYNGASSNGAGFYMPNGKTAAISGGSIHHNECTGSGSNGKGGGVYTNGSLYLAGGTVSANSALRGGGVYNDSSGKFFMYGSAVIGGASSAYGNKAVGTNCFGGGVFNAGYCYFGYSSWTDSSGTPKAWTGRVSANSSENNAGGVHNAGSFRMSSGTIGGATDAYANSASGNGGGIYCGGTNVITLGASAAIPPSSTGANDIYFNSSSNKIVLMSELTADLPAVGLLAISTGTSEALLNNGVTVVTAEEFTMAQFSACMNKLRLKQNLQWELKYDIPASASSWKANVTQDKEYVPVEGTTFSGGLTVSNSSVFITGRTLTIPKMIVGVHEVTQREFQKYCYYSQSNKTPSDTYGAGDNYPAYFTSWYDAIVYCNLRSIDDGLDSVYSLEGKKDPREWQYIVKDETTGKCSGPNTGCSAAVKTAWNNIAFDTSANGWRIPMEAEWEYLARGGSLTGTQYKYSGSDSIGDVAWYTGNASGKTHLVKSRPNTTTPKANDCGLYDMTGNIWEVCWDWGGSAYGEEYVYPITPTTGPTGVDSGIRRVVRGGSYNYGEAQSYVYYRGVNNEPQDRWENSGFRVVRNIP